MSSLVLMAILAVTALGTGGLYALASSNVSFNNVQISIQTASSLPYSYDVSAYNSSGSLVSYTQTNYPAAAFELPSGSYLFTVTAYDYTNYGCNVCMTPDVGASVPPSQSGSVTSSPAIIVNGGPEVEYGYSLQQISGQTSINIQTQNASSIATTTVTVNVQYTNGTAASGVSISAFVVGQSYYSWGPDSKISMSGQTDAQGIASLVVPAAPVELSATASLPVNLPQNETTVQTIVAGQKINVTVYWEPMYVYLSGSALVIPPQTSASITLTYQQSNNYYYPPVYASGSSSSGGYTTTVTNQQGGKALPPTVGQTSSTQTQNAPAARISPFTPTPAQLGHQAQSTVASGDKANNSTIVLLLGTATVVAIVVVLAAVFVVRSRAKK